VQPYVVFYNYKRLDFFWGRYSSHPLSDDHLGLLPSQRRSMLGWMKRLHDKIEDHSERFAWDSEGAFSRPASEGQCGLCMNWASLLTQKEMSGLVMHRYCSAPTVLWKRVCQKINHLHKQTSVRRMPQDNWSVLLLAFLFCWECPGCSDARIAGSH